MCWTKDSIAKITKSRPGSGAIWSQIDHHELGQHPKAYTDLQFFMAKPDITLSAHTLNLCKHCVFIAQKSDNIRSHSDSAGKKFADLILSEEYDFKASAKTRRPVIVVRPVFVGV